MTSRQHGRTSNQQLAPGLTNIALTIIRDRYADFGPTLAYDTDALLARIESKGGKAVIPPKANRKVKREFDRYQYRNGNLIERFFARIKQFRRVATQYNKLASRFASFVALAASLLWLK